MPAALAYHGYAAALAKVVYYWGYPLVDVIGRTGQWQVMKEPGLLTGLVPAAPMGHTGYLSDYLPRAQRWLVTPNNDTIYGSCLADLGQEPLAVETPTDVPEGQ